MKRRLSSLSRHLFRPTRLEADLDDELRSGLDILTDRFLARGLSPAEARAAARREFGSTARLKEDMRGGLNTAAIETCLQDARYACRGFWRQPSFTVVAVLTLALGIGVNSAVFSVVYAVLLKALPYDHPEQLAMIWSDFHKTAAFHAPASGTIFGEIQHRTRLLENVAAMWTTVGTFTGGDPEEVRVARVTTNFLDVLGVRPQLGRGFTPDEGAGGRSAIILSDGLWRRRFGADPGIIGRAVRFDGDSCTVVGVMPP